MESTKQPNPKLEFGDGETEGDFEIVKIDVLQDPPEKIMNILVELTALNKRDTDTLNTSVFHHSLFELYLRNMKI
jgi:hypothetical protein